MKREQIESILSNIETWKNAPDKTKESFIKEMEDKQEGAGSIIQAWIWFYTGTLH